MSESTDVPENEQPLGGPTAGDSTDASGQDGDLLETLSNRVASETVTLYRGTRLDSLEIGVTAAMFAVALALVTGIGGIYLLGIIGLGYSAFSWVTSLPETDIRIRRELNTATALPGDTVEVSLTVENVGDQTATDLRVFDGVPEALAVVEGSPSCYTGLRPGESTVITYSVRAKRGVHQFEDTSVVARDVSGTRETRRMCTVDMELTCRTLLDDLPLADQTLQRVGQVSTDEGGSGIEFFATREYRHGDPQSRIDWNRLAKTGSLTTIEYREQRVATVAILIDDRRVAKQAVDDRSLEALDLGIYAAERALEVLSAEGNRTALLLLSSDGRDSIQSGNGETHTARVRSALRHQSETFAPIEGAPATGSRRGGSNVDISDLLRRLPTNGQVLFVSPALDDTVHEVAETIAGSGREITLLSPDVTGGTTPGHRIESLDRALRLQSIRETGARVVDWPPERAVQVAVSRALALWGM